MNSSASSSLPRVVGISGVAALGGFLFGYDSGCINGAVGALQKAFGASDVASGFNVASVLLGCVVGAFAAGGVADRFGRRPVLFAAAIIFAVSAWGSGVAMSSLEFVLYRLLGGLAVGAASVICPAYISEVAPAAYRGRLATLQQLAIVLGLFIAFLVNYLIAGSAWGADQIWWLGEEAWRWMFWAELAPIAAFLLGLLCIPESPRYLVAAGRLEAARGVLARLMDRDAVDAQIMEIRGSLGDGHRPSFRDLRAPAGGLRGIVWLGVALAAFQQLVGINVVFYYGEVLWRAAGFTEAHALRINVIGGLINIIATFIAIPLVDRWGRRACS